MCVCVVFHCAFKKLFQDIFETLIVVLVKHIIKELQTIQREFLYGTANPKLKYDTLGNNYKQGGSKTIDVSKKIVGLTVDVHR